MSVLIIYYFYIQSKPTRVKHTVHITLKGPDLSVRPGLVQVHLVALVLVGLQHGQQRRGEVAAGLVLDDLLQVLVVL